MNWLLVSLLSFSPLEYACADKGIPAAEAEEDYLDLQTPVKKIKSADQQLSNPSTPPAVKEELKREREGEVQKIESVGTKKPDNIKAQTEVTKALSSVGENDRALPFADRGVALAEAKGDSKGLGQSLVLRAVVQQKRGKVEEAYADSSRACELNPANSKACQLALLTRGRTNALGGKPAGSAASGENPSGGSRSGPGEDFPGGSNPAPPGGTDAATREIPGGGVTTASADSLLSAGLVEQAKAKLKLDRSAGLKLLDRAVEADPKSAKARAARSQARRAGGDGAGALADAEAAVRLDPRSAEAFAARGQAKAALGRSAQEVAEDLGAARELDPSFSALYQETLAGLGGGSGAAPTAANAAAVAARPRGAPLRVWGPIVALGVLLFAAAIFLIRKLRRDSTPEGS